VNRKQKSKDEGRGKRGIKEEWNKEARKPGI